MSTEPPKLSKSQQRRQAARDAALRTQETHKGVVQAALTILVACLVFLPLGILAGHWSIASQLHQIHEAQKTALITPQAKPDDFFPDLGHLLALSPGQLEGTDIAAMNLACAQGLPGAENTDMAVALHTLDAWANHVRQETERNFHRFTDNPAQFHNSESWWRAAMMITVLQQDAGVRYDLTRMQDLSMTHAEDIFIPGLLGPRREGTCSSMPVFYVAIHNPPWRTAWHRAMAKTT